ncbi:MAG: mevalonate kinase, partial [Balneolaceae bacterium]
MNSLKVKASAPGKLILLGEYAVLENAPALVAAVNKQCRVEIKSVAGPLFNFAAPNLGLFDLEFTLDSDGNAQIINVKNGSSSKKTGFIFSILKYVVSRAGYKMASADIKIDTSDFYHPLSKQKLGLGSSAALTVSFLKALKEYSGDNWFGSNIFGEALKAHRAAQGKLGSGVDIASSVSGGIIEYRMPSLKMISEAAINQLDWPENLHVIAIWTGSSTSTRSFVRNVQAFRDKIPHVYSSIMEKMNDLC